MVKLYIVDKEINKVNFAYSLDLFPSWHNKLGHIGRSIMKRIKKVT